MRLRRAYTGGEETFRDGSTLRLLSILGVASPDFLLNPGSTAKAFRAVSSKSLREF